MSFWSTFKHKVTCQLQTSVFKCFISNIQENEISRRHTRLYEFRIGKGKFSFNSNETHNQSNKEEQEYMLKT